ncbi:HAD family hydrolase [Halomonas huangheensis]|uniref:Haloacid dehalogenase n=1 Tax=Halomonas huangheensis TaxID=1178482 RepID=W1N2C4_9GAMM|nr:HAD family phosphatase [Halomonas huangheensis]ALM51220.1 hypothetical protein AR456_02105 [Halomonas huangheensis]ERL49639.1 hypothetical protein BJB45_00545 [Halomonas huangheensis]
MPDTAFDLALFDLDDTLLQGDITRLWSEWLIERGWIGNGDAFRAAFAEHARAYAAGVLDMEEHLDLLLSPLEGRRVQEVNAEVDACLDERVMSRLYPGGLQRLEWHRQQGHRTLIISASTAQLVAPLARRLGADDVLSTALETAGSGEDRYYTGRATGIRTFRDGKLTALDAWLEGRKPRQSWGYSDSHNDLPLLEAVDEAWAIHPDPKLEVIARQRGWTMPNWR